MKKKIIPFIAAMIVMSACSNSNSELERMREENESLKVELSSMQATSTITDITDDTLTSNVESTSITEETTNTETISEQITQTSWKIKYYVDEFDRPTDNGYISGVFIGKFSNTIANDSHLSLCVSVESYTYNDEIKESIDFTLFEYDQYIVSNPYSHGVFYDVQVLEENGNTIKEKGYMSANGGESIFISAAEGQNSIINALLNNDKLTVRIDEEEGSSTYLFDIDCTGFAEIYKSNDWKS